MAIDSLISYNFLRVNKAYIFQFLSVFVPQIIYLFTSSCILSKCGKNSFALYTLIISYSILIINVFGTSIDTSFQRTGKRSNFSGYLNSKLIAVFFCIFILIGVLIFENIRLTIIIIVILILIVQQLLMSLNAYYRMTENDFYVFLNRVTPLIIILLLLLIFKNIDLENLFIITLVCWTLPLVFQLKTLKSKYSINLKNGINKLKDSRFILITIFLTQANGNLDLILLSKLMPIDVIPNFKLHYIMTSSYIPFISVLSYVFLSKVSKLDKNCNYLLIKETLKHLKIVFIISFISSLLVFTLFNPLMNILYKNTIVVSNNLLCSLIVSNFISSFTIVISFLCLSKNRDKIVLFANLIFFIFYFCLILIFTPLFSLNGVGYAHLLSNLMMFVFLTFKNINLVKS